MLVCSAQARVSDESAVTIKPTYSSDPERVLNTARVRSSCLSNRAPIALIGGATRVNPPSEKTV